MEIMSGDRYILDCPKCGRVEGFAPGDDDYDEGGAEAEAVIDVDVIPTADGPATRVRCPVCGLWLRADRARPV